MAFTEGELKFKTFAWEVCAGPAPHIQNMLHLSLDKLGVTSQWNNLWIKSSCFCKERRGNNKWKWEHVSIGTFVCLDHIC